MIKRPYRLVRVKNELSERKSSMPEISEEALQAYVPEEDDGEE